VRKTGKGFPISSLPSLRNDLQPCMVSELLTQVMFMLTFLYMVAQRSLETQSVCNMFPLVSSGYCATLYNVPPCNKCVHLLISGFRQSVPSLRMARYGMGLLFEQMVKFEYEEYQPPVMLCCLC
jgi:hypothetical protein